MDPSKYKDCCCNQKKSEQNTNLFKDDITLELAQIKQLLLDINEKLHRFESSSIPRHYI